MKLLHSVVFSGVVATGMAATGFAALSLGTPLPAQAAASPFTEQAVTPSSTVIIGAPLVNGYNLIVVEQASNQRPCWQTKDVNLGTIDPLLLNFDFTGICSRSTDSNGYSVRMAGEDLGMSYALRLVKRSNSVVLVGTPSRRGLPELELGRSRSVAADYLQIDLNPGWQLSRRVYQGKTLGHVYFSNANSLQNVIASQPKPINQPQPVKPAPVVSQPVTPVASAPVASAPVKPAPVATAPKPAALPGTIPTGQARYDALNALYLQVLGRPVDANGLKTYGRALDKGRSLDWVRGQLAKSSEGRRVAINRAYWDILKRPVDGQGLTHYMAKMETENWSIDKVRRNLAKTDEAQKLAGRR